jgi:hypothetical protein
MHTMRKVHIHSRPVVAFEAMESRTLMSTYMVTSTGDSGAGTLRQAILSANSSAGADTIKFAIGSGAKTISPISKLPALTGPTVVDATTQPGFAGKPLIELNGTNAGSTADGLKLTGGASTVKGFIINRFSGSGIFIYSKGGNRIVGNYIGTDKTGGLAQGNKAHGILVQSSGNTIGGTASADRNVIAGSLKAGVFVYTSAASANTILGNYIGTDVTGTKKLANNNGVQINGGANNTVGGTAAGSRNLLSGNTRDGILIVSTGSSSNKVQGNYIGTNAAGTGRLGNGWYGVEISQPNNVVGGTTSSARNVISANGMAGVVFYLTTGTGNRVEGNYIGTDFTGTKDLGNVGCGVDATNGASRNTVGGSTTASRNVIAGNDMSGVGIYNGSSYITVQNNYLGIGSTGMALPNSKHGVMVVSSSNNTVKDNKIAVLNTFNAVQLSGGSASQSGNTLFAKATLGLRVI